MATDLPFNDGEQIPDLGEGGQNVHDELVSLIQALDQVYVGDDADSVIDSEASEYAIGIDTQGDTELVTAGSGSAGIPLEVDGEDIQALKSTMQDQMDDLETEIEDNIGEDLENLESEVENEIQGETDISIEDLENDVEDLEQNYQATTETTSESADVETAEFVEVPSLPSGAESPTQGERTRGGRALVYDSENDVPDTELPNGTMVYVMGEGLFVVE